MDADRISLAGIDIAERAIKRVLHDYFRGIDRMDRDLVASCYHADAVNAHGSFEGGVQEFIDWAWHLLARYEHTMHLLADIVVDIQPDDGSVAACESYGIAFHFSSNPAPEPELVTGFRFADRLERRPDDDGHLGPWKIARRVATTEWAKIGDRPETSGSSGAPPATGAVQ